MKTDTSQKSPKVHNLPYGYSWCCAFYGFGQIFNPVCTVKVSFTALKVLCALPIHPFLPSSPWHHFYCPHSFAFPGTSSHWNHTVCCLFRWASFTEQCTVKFPPFHGLIVHFFLALNHISLSGCITVYLATHLLRNILVASKF